MKKIILLIAIGAFFISSKSEAQHFIASFGTQHHWNVPQRVSYTVSHDYYGYNWVHAKRIVRGGNIYFDVLLQRGDVFVEVNIGARGRIFGRTYFNNYPLRQHVCNSYCGFHSNYYNTYRATCSSHYHHGHNHVVYRPNRYVTRHNHVKGHKYGHYKKHNNHWKGNKGNNRVNRTPVRRDRYYNSRSARSGHHRNDRNRVDRNNRNDRDDKGDRRGGRDRGNSERHQSRRAHYNVDK